MAYQETTVTEQQLKRKIDEITKLNITINKDYLHAKKTIRTLTFERNLLLDSIHRLEQNTEDSQSEVESELSDFNEEREDSPKTLKKLALKPTTTTRSKNNTVTKIRRIQPIQRGLYGQPILPQQIGILKIISLGKIITDRPQFHNERYIYPVGYSVSRTYPSMINPNTNTIITSTIEDGGEGPRFVVTAEDMPNDPIIGKSATGVWTVVVRRTNKIRHRDHSNPASGPDYYGFKHPTIANLIQELPGAKDLKHYVWKQFESHPKESFAKRKKASW